MVGHVPDQHVLVDEPAATHAAPKRRLLVADELFVAPQVAQALVGGDAEQAAVAPVLR